MPPGPLAELLTLANLDELAGDRCLRENTMLRVCRADGSPSPRLTWMGRPVDRGFEEVVRAAGVSAALSEGYTLLFDALHRTWPPLRELCRRLSFEIGVPVVAGSFVTPAGNQGFKNHYDSLSVLIVQTVGSKSWQVHTPVLADPLPHQLWNERNLLTTDRERLERGRPFLEAVLRPGHVLWIPRGWIHSAVATDEPSVHVSLGLESFTPYWLAKQLLQYLDAAPELRRELPWGIARDPGRLKVEVAETVRKLIEALGTIDLEAATDEVAKEMRKGFPEPARAPVSSILANPIEPDTEVSLAPESICGTILHPDGKLELDLRDDRLVLDAEASMALLSRWPMDSEAVVRAADFAPELGEETALRMVSSLARAGVARVVRRSSPDLT